MDNRFSEVRQGSLLLAHLFRAIRGGWKDSAAFSLGSRGKCRDAVLVWNTYGTYTHYIAKRMWLYTWLSELFGHLIPKPQALIDLELSTRFLSASVGI